MSEFRLTLKATVKAAPLVMLLFVVGLGVGCATQSDSTDDENDSLQVEKGVADEDSVDRISRQRAVAEPIRMDADSVISHTLSRSYNNLFGVEKVTLDEEQGRLDLQSKDGEWHADITAHFRLRIEGDTILVSDRPEYFQVGINQDTSYRVHVDYEEYETYSVLNADFADGVQEVLAYIDTSVVRRGSPSQLSDTYYFLVPAERLSTFEHHFRKEGYRLPEWYFNVAVSRDSSNVSVDDAAQ